MSLSKPVIELLALYLEQLYTHPVRTKSISSCVVASLGNLTSQYVAGNKTINQDSVIAYGIYGLLFGGSVPHYFYLALDQIVPVKTPRAGLKRLLIERLLFVPLYQAFSLYMLSRLEGKTHKEAVKNLLRIYAPVLKANWIYLTVPQLINIAYVPPMLRSIVASLIGFIWIVFISLKRRRLASQGDNRQ